MSARRKALVVSAVCGCGTPTRDDAFVCDGCLDQLASDLRELRPASNPNARPVTRVVTAVDDQAGPWCVWPRPLADELIPGLWADLLSVVVGEQGVDYRTVGPGSPSDSTGIALDELAVEIAHTVRSTLKALVLLCEDTRVPHTSPSERRPAGTVPGMAEWLSWRIDGLAWQPEAAGYVAQIRAVVESVRWVVDRPETRQQLGPCPVTGCDGTLSAAEGDAHARCYRCKAKFEARPLRDQALAKLGARLCTASEIARLSTYLGLAAGSRDVVRNRINQWHTRGQLTPAGYEDDGSPRFRFGAVYDRLLEHERRHRHEFTDWTEATEQPDPGVLTLTRSCTYETCTETQTKTKHIPKNRRTANRK